MSTNTMARPPVRASAGPQAGHEGTSAAAAQPMNKSIAP